MRTAGIVQGLAAAVLMAGVGGCARPPSLGSVLKEKYPGYQQVLPATSVSLRDRDYEFVPGTMLTASQLKPASRTETAVWQADPIYCPPGYPLAELRVRVKPAVATTYNFDLSLRRLLHRSKAKADLNLEENEIEFIRRVDIKIDSPRTYSIRGGNPAPQYVRACIDSLMQRPGLRRIRSIIVGNVRVAILFKDNVSLMAKWSVANKVNSSLGFGVLSGESYTINGNDLVFGADLVGIKK